MHKKMEAMNKTKSRQYAYHTITELLDIVCQTHSGKRLFIEERNRDNPGVDYDRFRQDILLTAGKLQAMEEKHIGVMCDLSYSCLLCILSVMVSGKVAVLIEADLPKETLCEQIKRADVDLLLYPKERMEGEPPCPAMTQETFLARDGMALSAWPVWEPERDACILFSSGTEGTSGCVLLTQRNLARYVSYYEEKDSSKQSKVLFFLPFHHVTALITLVNCICYGCEIHLSESIKYVTEEIRRVRPDMLITVPVFNEMYRKGIEKAIDESGKRRQFDQLVRLSNMLRRMGIDLRTPLFKSLRRQAGELPQLFATGGSASSVDTIRFFDDIGIIVLQAYGLTETTGIIATNTLDANRIGSVGKPAEHCEIRIRDSQIQVRGMTVMKGYYKDPQATARAFDGEWLNTGDLGRFDSDGYLYITGRKKNLIILGGGENVSPEELEEALMACPCVSEVVVSERNGCIHAEIYPGAQPKTAVEAARKAIEAHIREMNTVNPTYKRIASWELRKTPFDKTTGLKIRRTYVREDS